jgi:hypothetical protein
VHSASAINGLTSSLGRCTRWVPCRTNNNVFGGSGPRGQEMTSVTRSSGSTVAPIADETRCAICLAVGGNTNGNRGFRHCRVWSCTFVAYSSANASDSDSDEISLHRVKHRRNCVRPKTDKIIGRRRGRRRPSLFIYIRPIGSYETRSRYLNAETQYRYDTCTIGRTTAITIIELQCGYFVRSEIVVRLC